MKRTRIIRIGFLVLTLAVMAVSLSFSAIEMKNLACASIYINIKGENQFITAGEIERILNRKEKKLKGCLLDTLNTERLEALIRVHPWVKGAEVFKGIGKSENRLFSGCLNIRIDQRNPVMKFISGGDIVYVDETGKLIPFSSSATKNVVVVTGHSVQDALGRGLIDFVQYINKNKFWKAQIQQIHFQSGPEILMVPRVGGHLIELGSLNGYEQKLACLRAFYDKELSKNGWDRYKKISLKYDRQIVCTRKN